MGRMGQPPTGSARALGRVVDDVLVVDPADGGVVEVGFDAAVAAVVVVVVPVGAGPAGTDVGATETGAAAAEGGVFEPVDDGGVVDAGAADSAVVLGADAVVGVAGGTVVR